MVKNYRRAVQVMVVGLLVGLGINVAWVRGAEGPVTPGANIGVTADNGRLVVYSYVTSGTVGPVTPLANLGLKADNGRLSVVVAGGTMTPDTICLDATNQDACISRLGVGSLAVTHTAIATTSADGWTLQNTTAATSGVPIQYSPALHFTGHVWNTTVTAADNYAELKQELRPISSAAPSSSLYFSIRNSASGSGSFTDKMDINFSSSVSGLYFATSPITCLSNIGNEGSTLGYCIDNAVASNRLFTSDYRGISFRSYDTTNAYQNQVSLTGSNLAPNFLMRDTVHLGFVSGDPSTASIDWNIGWVSTHLATLGATDDIRVPNQKSSSGTRYVCIDTNGKLISSAAVCAGT